jgi:hypothetical protein
LTVEQRENSKETHIPTTNRLSWVMRAVLTVSFKGGYK